MLAFFTVLFLTLSKPFVSPVDPRLEDALSELDRCILQQERISLIKEARIDSLRQCGFSVNSSYEKYHLFDLLFDEYYKWNTDSAFVLAHRKSDLAQEIGDVDLIIDAAGDLANRYIISSMYHEALGVLQSVDSSYVVQSSNVGLWNSLLYEIYHGLVLVTPDRVLKDEYRKKESFYLALSRQYLAPGPMAYYTANVKRLILEHRYNEALAMVNEWLSSSSLSYSEMAFLHYWLASVYTAMEDDDNSLLHYAISAKYDLLMSNRECASLAMVARLCFKRGDLKRAYNYIIRNYSDAVDVDAKLREVQIAGTLPYIVTSYEKRESYFRRQLLFFLTGLLALLVLLVVAINFIRRNNRRLREANHIKNTYLGEFMALFADHINSLEKYRSNLRVTAKKQDFDALVQELRSDDFIDAEWDYLMDKFDKTFLGLFPNFISQLNGLLRKDRQIGAGLPKGVLTNQLRIYALLRLGVTKSSRIAKFLRLSSSTVYNSRVTLRNSAADKRDDIEVRLMKLGS